MILYSVVTGNDGDKINKLKGFLGTEFEIKDLGLLKCFLRLEVVGYKNGIVIS